MMNIQGLRSPGKDKGEEGGDDGAHEDVCNPGVHELG